MVYLRTLRPPVLRQSRVYKKLLQKKDQLIAGFAKYRQDQLADGRFTLVRTQAKFSDPHTGFAFDVLPTALLDVIRAMEG